MEILFFCRFPMFQYVVPLCRLLANCSCFFSAGRMQKTVPINSSRMSACVCIYIQRTSPSEISHPQVTSSLLIFSCVNMSDKKSWKCRVAGDNEIEQSSRNENNSSNYSLQSYVTDHPNYFPTFHSLETITSELNDFQEVFGDLMDIQPSVASSSSSLVQVNTSFTSKLGPDHLNQVGQSRNPVEMLKTE